MVASGFNCCPLRRSARDWGAVPQGHLRSKGGKVDMLPHHLQRITKLVKLGFALLVGKQTGLDNENLCQA
jgi:hypothetical protein